MSRIRGVLKHTGVYSCGSIAEKALHFFLIPLYTTYLSTGEFGAYVLMVFVGELITKIAYAPATEGLVRFYNAPQYRERRGELVFLLFCQAGVMGGVLFGLFVIGGRVVSILLFGNMLYLSALYLYGVTILLRPIAQLALTLLRMREQSFCYVSISLIRMLTTVLTVFLGLSVFSLGVHAVVGAQVIGTLIVAAYGIVVLLKNATFSLDLAWLRQPLKYGIPLLPSSYSTFLIDSADRLLLKLLVSMEVTGIYSIAYRISSPLNFVLSTPLKQAFQPAALQLESVPEKMCALINRSAVLYAFIGGTFSLSLALFSKEIVQILARDIEYWSAWKVVPIVCLAFYIQGFSKFTGYGLLMAKRTSLITSGLVLAAVLNISLNIVLIPPLGMTGAAWATVAAYLFWTLWKAFFSMRCYGLRFDWLRISASFGLAILIYLVSIPLLKNISSLWLSVTMKCLCVGLFPLVAWFGRIVGEGAEDEVRTLFGNLLKGSPGPR